MTLDNAIDEACHAVGIVPPKRTVPGRWVTCPVEGKSPKNTSGRVLIWPDGTGGVAWNWVTGQKQTFRITNTAASVRQATATRHNQTVEQRDAAETAEIARICDAIVRACRHDRHPYLASKGFPEMCGLVIDDLRPLIPQHELGRAICRALPNGPGPWLIVPGRREKTLATVQIIGHDGAKRNLLRGQMSGACYRISTGIETWVCEGIATALSVRAALQFLGRSATVLCAFAANNVARVAASIRGSIVAADNDKPNEFLGGLGTGEYYARASGRQWTMPPEPGDWNDYHQRHGLRATALLLREVRPQ
jgi:putative DNA primase/helicase